VVVFAPRHDGIVSWVLYRDTVLVMQPASNSYTQAASTDLPSAVQTCGDQVNIIGALKRLMKHISRVAKKSKSRLVVWSITKITACNEAMDSKLRTLTTDPMTTQGHWDAKIANKIMTKYSTRGCTSYIPLRGYVQSTRSEANDVLPAKAFT
jgi:predicted methyltransferase